MRYRAHRKGQPRHDVVVLEDLADGFYFTVADPGMTRSERAAALMRIGIRAIALDVTGGTREGVRVCVFPIADDDFDVVARPARQLVARPMGSVGRYGHRWLWLDCDGF